MEEENEDGKETTERKLMNIPSTNNRGVGILGKLYTLGRANQSTIVHGHVNSALSYLLRNSAL